MKRSKLSLATAVIAIIVVIVSVTLAIVSTIAYRSYSTQQWDAFNSAVDLEADRMVIALAPAVWNLEIPQIQKLMESLMQDPRYAGIVVNIGKQKLTLVRDQKGRSINATEPPSVPESLVRQRPVIYADEAIGELVLYATSTDLQTELRQARDFFIALALLLAVLLTLALYLSMQRLILRPLRHVERYAHDVASNRTVTAGYGQLALFGELNRLAGSIDTLLRQLAERNRELERSSARFKTVIRLLPIPIVLYGDDGINVYVNERFVAAFGYTLEDIPDAASWFELAYPDPAYRAEVIATWQQEVASAQAEHRPIRAIPYRIRCRDGAIKYVEIGGILSNDINIATLADVTDRTLAEEELRRYREHLEELVDTRTAELVTSSRRLQETQFAMDHAGIGIAWIAPENGRFLYVNDRACELFGKTREAVLHANVTDVTDEFTHERSQALAHDLLIHGYTRLETSVGHAGGKRLPIEVSLYYQPPTAEVPAGRYCAFITDITQRKAVELSLIEAKQAAELSAKTRSEFLANMSHEIRTPMNAIIGMSELALNGPLEAKQRNFITKVNQSAVALLGILNDILDFSKVEAGRLDIESIPFDVDTVFDHLGNVATHLADKKGLTFLFDLPAELPSRLIGDPARLGQILSNLVSNAIKFTEAGTVTVSVRALAEREPGQIRLNFAVRDTGVGMNANQIGALFSPFQQGDNSISRRYGGTGLGLAISKQLAELMDGRIAVSSKPGMGSTFTVSIPFRLTDDRISDKPAPTGYFRDQTALVIHPNNETRAMLCRMLGNFGMQTTGVDSGKEAIARLRDGSSWQFLLCATTLPDQPGTDLIRDTQAILGNRAPRCLVLGTSTELDALQGSTDDIGPCTLVTAPLRPATLLAALQVDGDLASEPENIAAPSVRRLDGLNILLVEDNELNQELALEILEGHGARVSVADNGRVALELLAEQNFDCVLMDVQMPVMDGLSTTRALRANPRWKTLPIIAMTAGALSDEREQTRLAGMDAHITKPIQVETFIDTILRLTGTIPAEQLAVLQSTDGPPSPSDQVLDADSGLRVVSGNQKTYVRLLGILADQTGKRIEDLCAACAAGEHETAGGIAHAIRGTCASLGANQLASLMHQIELACSKRLPTFELQALAKKAIPIWLETETACLEYRAQATGSPLPAACASLMTALAGLRLQLLADDLEAINCAHRLFEEAIPETLQAAVLTLEKKVKSYQFDEALSDVDQLIEALSGKTSGDSPE